MGIKDKIREFKESREEQRDQEQMQQEVEVSAERIQRERELQRKERAGKISVDLAKKRREDIARDYESNKIPLKHKVQDTISQKVTETLLPKKQPTFSQGRQRLTEELREASRVAPHGKSAGPLNVIGVGGVRKINYITDGHGRSGQRATLEWRRENRQYRSEQRKDAAGINQNFVNDLLGREPEPVRQRKVHTKKGKAISQLDWFVSRL